MNTTESKSVILECIHKIAPEADLEKLNPEADLRAELDIDSMDFLRLMVDIHEKTGIEIPEEDYPKLATLNKMIDYLGRNMN